MSSTLDFYFLDAHENARTKPNVCSLFGKVRADDGSYKSACVFVQQLEQRVYVQLRDGVTLEHFAKYIEQISSAQGFPSTRYRMARRRLIDAKERDGDRLGVEQDVVEFLYPIKDSSKPFNLQPEAKSFGAKGGDALRPGDVIARVIETQVSPVEQILLDRAIRGPCWLTLSNVVASRRGTTYYCASVHEIANSSCIAVKRESVPPPPPPPLRIASLSMTFEDHAPTDAKDVLHQLRSFTCMIHCDAAIATDCNEQGFLRDASQTLHTYHCTYVEPERFAARSTSLRPQFVAASDDVLVRRYDNERRDGLSTRSVKLVQSLEAMYAELERVFRDEDPDLVVGHNSLRYSVPRLLAEMKRRSRLRHLTFLGRLRTTQDPYFLRSTKDGRANFADPNPSYMSLEGRLHFDTLILSESFVTDRHARSIRSDSLQEHLEAHGVQRSHSRYHAVDTSLSAVPLGAESARFAEVPRGEQAASGDRVAEAQREHGADTFVDLYEHEVRAYLGRDDSLQRYIANHMNGAYKQLCLLYKLDLVMFTLEVTNMCGNLWRNNLGLYKMNRIEYLLMHEMHAANYAVPREPKRFGGETGQKSGESLRGGTVLETRAGEYNGFSCLFDASRLYPSIIHQHQLCVTNPHNLAIEDATHRDAVLVLPRILSEARQRRSEYAERRRGLDPSSSEFYRAKIGEEALKLISNQCYGCLGSPYFRFYNKSTGAEITRIGRANLERYCATIGERCDDDELEIIYGHTDSLMVHAKNATRSFADCHATFRDILAALNSLDNGIEVKIDAIFRKVVLYTQTQYVGLQLVDPASYSDEVTQRRADAVAAYRVYIRGCELVNRQMPALAQHICAKILNEALLCNVVADVTPETLTERLEAYATRVKRLLLGDDETLSWSSVLARLNGVTGVTRDRLLEFLSALVHTTVLNKTSKTAASKTPPLAAIQDVEPRHVQVRFERRRLPIQLVHCRTQGGVSIVRGRIAEMVFKQSAPEYSGTTRLAVDLRYFYNVHLGSLLQKTFELIDCVDVKRTSEWFGVDYAEAKRSITLSAAKKLTGDSTKMGAGVKRGRVQVYDAFRERHLDVLKFAQQLYRDAEAAVPIVSGAAAAVRRGDVAPLLPAAYDLIQMQIFRDELVPVELLCSGCAAKPDKERGAARPYVPFTGKIAVEDDDEAVVPPPPAAAPLFAVNTFLESHVNRSCGVCATTIDDEFTERLDDAFERHKKAMAKLPAAAAAPSPAAAAIAHRRFGSYESSPQPARSRSVVPAARVVNARYAQWLVSSERDSASTLQAKGVSVVEIAPMLKRLQGVTVKPPLADDGDDYSKNDTDNDDEQAIESPAKKHRRREPPRDVDARANIQLLY